MKLVKSHRPPIEHRSVKKYFLESSSGLPVFILFVRSTQVAGPELFGMLLLSDIGRTCLYCKTNVFFNYFGV